MSKPWQYDETIQIGTDYRDSFEVAAYDERMGRLRDVPAETRAIAKSLGLTSASVVWEIGTGTGECALALAGIAALVFATDVSPAMLAYARDKAEKRGIPNVQFESGGFLSGFRPAGPVDAIVTQLALHHLPDFWKSRALSAMAEALRPGGRLYLRDVVFPSNVPDYDAYFSRVIDGIRAKAGDAMAEPTVQHIRKEYSTLDWILEGMIQRSGLRLLTKESNGFLSCYVCEKQGRG